MAASTIAALPTPWYGEGDDMILVDGEPFPPSLHGTGTDDYFNTAWCPTQEYSAPYHGLVLPGEQNWWGKVSMYRFHVEDPVRFRRSIRVTIEHGHANRRWFVHGTDLGSMFEHRGCPVVGGEGEGSRRI